MPDLRRVTHPLRRWRERQRLTQREAALACGVIPQSWANYERGATFPRRDVLRRIIHTTGVSPGALVRAYIDGGPS
jgi:transcriptional regulator with XRE-family HTH domain